MGELNQGASTDHPQPFIDVPLGPLNELVTEVYGRPVDVAGGKRLVGGTTRAGFELPGERVVRAKVRAERAYEAERWARQQCLTAGMRAPPIMGLRHRELSEDQILSVCVEEKAAGQPLLDVFRTLGPTHESS